MRDRTREVEEAAERYFDFIERLEEDRQQSIDLVGQYGSEPDYEDLLEDLLRDMP